METILASPPIAFSIAWAVLVVFGQCTAQFLPVTRRTSVTPFSLAVMHPGPLASWTLAARSCLFLYSEMVTFSPETVQSRAVTGAGWPRSAVFGVAGVGTHPRGASLVAISCAVSLAADEFFTFEEAVLEGRVVEDPEPA